MPKLPDKRTMLWREFVVLRWLGQRFGMNEAQKDRYEYLASEYFNWYWYDKNKDKIVVIQSKENPSAKNETQRKEMCL